MCVHRLTVVDCFQPLDLSTFTHFKGFIVCFFLFKLFLWVCGGHNDVFTCYTFLKLLVLCVVFFFTSGWGLNFKFCIYYLLSLSIEISSRGRSFVYQDLFRLKIEFEFSKAFVLERVYCLLKPNLLVFATTNIVGLI